MCAAIDERVLDGHTEQNNVQLKPQVVEADIAKIIPENKSDNRWPFVGVSQDFVKRYIDERVTAVSVSLPIGTVFLKLDNSDKDLEIPLSEFDNVDKSYDLIPIYHGNAEFSSRQEAFTEVQKAHNSLKSIGRHEIPCMFYNGPGQLIWPTVINKQTMPRTIPTFGFSLEAGRTGAAATAKVMEEILWWYIGARFPAKIDSPPAAKIASSGQVLNIVNQKLGIFGERAIGVVSKAFGDTKHFELLVERIRSITKPTEELISKIETYFQKLGFAEDAVNIRSLDRLRRITAGKIRPDKGDIDFLQHELLELELVNKGIHKGYILIDDIKQAWDPAHDITRTALGVDVPYHPSVK